MKETNSVAAQQPHGGRQVQFAKLKQRERQGQAKVASKKINLFTDCFGSHGDGAPFILKCGEPRVGFIPSLELAKMGTRACIRRSEN